MVTQRIDADVDQQEDFVSLAWLQQALFADRRQGQGDALLQAAEQVEQLVLAQVATTRVQGQTRAAVDHAVAVGPGQQFEQLAAAFDRGEVLPLVHAKIAVVQAPVKLPGLFAVGRLDQGQGVFGEVRGDPRVDEFDFAGAAFEGRIQASAKDAEVALVDAAGGVLATGELAQEAVAVVELGHQLAALDLDLAHFPLAAAVEQGQLTFVPAPFLAQPLQQVALPAGAALAGQATEFLVHFQVQAAAHQFQALLFAAP
ncbi:hypothetical protein D3C81_741700 [compost metagenome]